jgi:hypothetical protein
MWFTSRFISANEGEGGLIMVPLKSTSTLFYAYINSTHKFCQGNGNVFIVGIQTFEDKLYR